jgi:predicted PurR-regulated permease PerM
MPRGTGAWHAPCCAPGKPEAILDPSAHRKDSMDRGDSSNGVTTADASAEAAATPAPPADQEDTPLVLRAKNWAQIVVAVGVVIALLRFAEDFFVPLFIGILASYTMQPLVTGLTRLRVPRALGAALVLGGALVLTAGIVNALWADAVAVFDQLPTAARKLRQSLQSDASASGPLASMREAATELDRAASAASGQRAKPAAPAPTPSVSQTAQQFVVARAVEALEIASQLLVAVLIAYFLLSAGDFFRRKLARLAGPTLAKRRVTVEILHEIDLHVQRYMLVLLLTNVLIGLATWGFFLAMGVERAGLWGLIAAIFHTVPYAGIALVALAGAVAGLVQFGEVTTALYVAGGVLIIAAAIGTGLNTWIQSRASRMNAVVVFSGVLFFGWLWGAWGLLLGVPLLAVLKTIADRIPEMMPLSELMGD